MTEQEIWDKVHGYYNMAPSFQNTDEIHAALATLGIPGELGEIVELMYHQMASLMQILPAMIQGARISDDIKKQMAMGWDRDKGKMGVEIFDTVYYLRILAKFYGLDWMKDVLLPGMAKLDKRYYDRVFSVEASKGNRDE